MIIDFHTHIFPREIREKRGKYFINEPEFTLLYSLPKSRLVGARELIDVMDELEIDMAVIFGFPWKNPTTLKKHNDYIAEATKRFPGRFAAFGCIDPFSDQALKEAERCRDEKFAGIGELAFYQSGIDAAAIKRLAPIMEICRQSDIPVLIHTNEPIGHHYPGKAPMTFSQIYGLIQRFPHNKIVLAHWGGGIFFFNLVKKQVKAAFKNIYFDTAASPFLYDPQVYQTAVQIVGPEKILFGSDYPLITPARYFKEMEMAGLSQHDTRRICGQNAADLLKLETI